MSRGKSPRIKRISITDNHCIKNWDGEFTKMTIDCHLGTFEITRREIIEHIAYKAKIKLKTKALAALILFERRMK